MWLLKPQYCTTSQYTPHLQFNTNSITNISMLPNPWLAIEIILQNHFNFVACSFMITCALSFHFIAHLSIFTTIIKITVRCNQKQTEFTIYFLCHSGAAKWVKHISLSVSILQLFWKIHSIMIVKFWVGVLLVALMPSWNTLILSVHSVKPQVLYLSSVT